MFQNDTLVVEDESGRIQLVGDHVDSTKGVLVTGVVVACRGMVNKFGQFEVCIAPIVTETRIYYFIGYI